MKPSPPSLSPDQLETLLSRKITPARPRPGFTGRVMERLPTAREAPARPGVPPWGFAIAAAVVAGLVVTALLFQETREPGPGPVADASTQPTHQAVNIRAGLVAPTIDAGLWTGFPIEKGLAEESDALRKDVGRFGGYLVRTIPRLPAPAPGLDG